MYEMWHFIGSKKTNFGCGRRIAAIPVSLSIGKWRPECGNFEEEAGASEAFPDKVYFSDHWEASAQLNPAGLLVQTQAQTHAIERNNARQRHGCGDSDARSAGFPGIRKWWI
jgi:hypothetical protein